MRLLALPVLFVAVGCGSDGTKKPMLLDAKVFLDAGVDAPPTCAVKTMFGGLTLNIPTMPSDWFFQPPSGPNMGKQVLDISAALPDSTATLRDILSIRYIKPLQGFALNTAVPFDPSPTSTTAVAFAILFGDYDTGTMMEAMDYWGSTGSLTLTAIGEADGASIKGMMATTAMRQIDANGADVAGGCATSLTGLAFDLKQMNMPFVQGSPDILEVTRLMPGTPLSERMDRIQEMRTAE